MFKLAKIFIVAIGFVGLFSPHTLSAEKDTIALIDFQKILETSSAGKAAQADINVQGKKMEQDLKGKGDEIKELEKKLELERMVLSKEAREEKLREVRIKINDYKSLQTKYRASIKKLESKVIGKIQDDVFSVVEKIAKENNYLLVLERRAGGVIYGKEALDITDEVIAQYDKKVASEPKKATE